MMRFWLIRPILVIATGIFLTEGALGLNSHATISGIHRSPNDDTKFNSYTASCKSDETALTFEFKWKRWNGDGWTETITNGHSNSLLYNWKPNNSTTHYTSSSFSGIGRSGTNLIADDFEPWELGMVGCRTKGGYKGNIGYTWAKITRKLEDVSNLAYVSSDIKCRPSVPLRVNTPNETFLNMYEVDNKIEGDNKFLDCEDDGEKLRCKITRLFQPGSIYSFGSGDKVGCVYNGAIQMSTFEDKKERGLQTYYPEGGMYNFRCYLKKAGTVEWTWGNPEDNTTHVLSRNNEALSTLPAEISDRYKFSLRSFEQEYVTALTVKDAKPWESGTFGCRTVKNDGTVIQSASRDINIADKGKININISTNLSLDENGHHKMEPGMDFLVTCNATASHVAPLLSLSMGRITYRAAQSQTSDLVIETVPALGMTTTVKHVTARYNVTSLTCAHQCDVLTCSASGPASQHVTDGVRVTIKGCPPCKTSAGSVFGAAMTGFVSMVIAAIIIG